MKIRTLFLIILTVFPCFIPDCLAKRDNYKITLTIQGNTDSLMLMGYYYAENMYVLDTARRDSKGRFVFSSTTKELLPGMYFFSTAKQTKWVDFVVYHEKPFFTFSTNEADWTANMEVKGSKENEVLFDYQRASGLAYRENDELMLSADSAQRVQYRIQLQQKQVDIKNQTIQNHPNCMISKVMLATKEVPTPFTSPEGDTLSNTQRYEYFMHHYFDNMPLDDDMLVRTPRQIFYQKVMDYFDKYLKGAPPETIIAYADSLIERSRPSKENFKWLVHSLKEKYLHSNITIYEAVCVHIIKRYYSTGEAFWCPPSTLDEINAAAEKWDRLLIGKVPPELILFDTNHVPHSLHNLPHRYKLLVFWSPTCGHCKVMIPALYEKYAQLCESYDIGAFAILSEPDEATRPKWHQFIAQHHLDWLNLDGGEANIDWHDVYDIVTTPQIYLLDENNQILAKKLNAETFEKIVKAICKPKES